MVNKFFLLGLFFCLINNHAVNAMDDFLLHEECWPSSEKSNLSKEVEEKLARAEDLISIVRSWLHDKLYRQTSEQLTSVQKEGKSDSVSEESQQQQKQSSSSFNVSAFSSLSLDLDVCSSKTLLKIGSSAVILALLAEVIYRLHKERSSLSVEQIKQYIYKHPYQIVARVLALAISTGLLCSCNEATATVTV